MSTTITLQDLIEKVKSDLFLPVLGTPAEGKKAYPIFLVDQVELELQVEFSSVGKAGIKIMIPQFIEGSAEGEKSKTSGHTMKVVLRPVLTTDEMREILKQDERLWKGINEASITAFRKDEKLSGEEE